MRKNLAFVLELIVIGIVAIVMDLLIYKLLTGEFPSTKLPYYWKMILGAFLLGASIHFLFEILGLNEKWCKITYQI